MSFKPINLQLSNQQQDNETKRSWFNNFERLDRANASKQQSKNNQNDDLSNLEMVNKNRSRSIHDNLNLGIELKLHDIQDQGVATVVDHCINTDDFHFVLMPLNKPVPTKQVSTNIISSSKQAKDQLLPDIALPSFVWKNHVAANLGFPETFMANQSTPNPFKAFEQALDHALYLAVPAIFIGCPQTDFGCLTLASIINNRIRNLPSINKTPLFVIRVPLSYSQYLTYATKQSSPTPDTSSVENSSQSSSSDKVIESQNDEEQMFKSSIDTQASDWISETGACSSSWTYWNKLRNYLLPDSRICVDLIINDDLPEKVDREKWLGEPLRIITLTNDQFISSLKGNSCLPTATRDFVTKLVRSNSLQVSFILSFATKIEASHEDYFQYFNNISKKLWKSISIPDLLNYEDFLLAPLQPLSSNLESATYEIFETDSIKYTKYRDAMIEAFKDIAKSAESDKSSNKNQSNNMRKIVVMVVGAGRGPLVHACIQAINLASILDDPKIMVKIFAVEKNPSSILTIKEKKATIWSKIGPKVSIDIVHSDMREWRPSEKADLIVSELLGSFSDNELSPECIDGVYKCCKETTISIPQSYSSYVAPISSYRLHQEINCQMNFPKHHPFDTIYVVKITNHYMIDKPKKLFTFEHSKPNIPFWKKDNTRYCKLNFKSSTNVPCHGFGAYFDAVLYKDVKLSTVPGSSTPNMHSWFPAFIPIERPIFIKENTQLTLHFWRKQSESQVWYEWALAEPYATRIHSPDAQGTAMSKFLK